MNITFLKTATDKTSVTNRVQKDQLWDLSVIFACVSYSDVINTPSNTPHRQVNVQNNRIGGWP